MKNTYNHDYLSHFNLDKSCLQNMCHKTSELKTSSGILHYLLWYLVVKYGGNGTWLHTPTIFENKPRPWKKHNILMKNNQNTVNNSKQNVNYRWTLCSNWGCVTSGTVAVQSMFQFKLNKHVQRAGNAHGTYSKRICKTSETRRASRKFLSMFIFPKRARNTHRFLATYSIAHRAYTKGTRRTRIAF